MKIHHIPWAGNGKILLSLILGLLISCGINAQWCVNTLNISEGGLTCAESASTMVKIDPSGNIWFNLVYSTGEGGYGLAKYTGSEWVQYYNKSEIPNPIVNDVSFDKTDSVWVATNDGLALFDGNNQTGWKIFKTANSDLPDNMVTAIEVDQDNVKWMGFNSGQVARLDGKTWTIYNEYKTGTVNDIELGADGSVWVARNGVTGLSKLRAGKWTVFKQFSNVKDIRSDQYGRTMVASRDTLYILRADTIHAISVAHRDLLEIKDIEVAPGGTIWLSSSQGLLQSNGSRLRLFSNENSALPRFNYPPPLLVSDKGDIWFSYVYKESFNLPALGYTFKTDPLTTSVSAADRTEPILCYGESLTLDANTQADSYVWTSATGDVPAGRTLTVYDSDTVDVAIRKDNCYYYDTVTVKAQHVFEDEDPCAVTVTLDNKNLVVWEKTSDVGTESYNVYRELYTDSFTHIGNIPAEKLSIFVDEGSDARVRSYKYRITSLDTCGNESLHSIIHKTMHMTASLGADTTQVNLVWQNYEGFFFPYYIIFRGTTPDNLIPIDSIPVDDNTLTYTDIDVSRRYYYRIGVKLPAICAPTGTLKAGAGPYQHSMSNLEDNKLKWPALIPGSPENSPSVWPNPFSNQTRIEFSNPSGFPYHFSLYDLSGRMVKEISNINGNSLILHRNKLPAGIYIFELAGEQCYTGKLVID